MRHYLESLKQHFSGKIFVYASGVAILDILFIEPKTLLFSSLVFAEC